MTAIEELHAHLRGEHSDIRSDGCPACVRLPLVSVEAETPVRQNTARPPTGRLCECNCGKPVKRRFLPGHDAKLKSRLVKEARAGSKAALQNLRENGWEHFV